MAEVANNSVFSQNDSSNTGALPGLSGTSPPSQIDNSIRALMGATKREHDWRNYSVTSTGSANAYVLTYSVAPDAYYTGQRFAFKTNFAVTGAATVNVNSLGAKTIKKIVSGASTDLSSGDIASGDYIDLVYDGTNFVWVNRGGTSVASTTEQLTGTDANRASTPDSVSALWEKGSDVASASTLTLGEGGYFHVTGTTTITDIDFGTAKDGRKAILVFDGVLTLTHNATTLICPTGASITTAVGDTCMVVQDSSDNMKIAWYQRASGAPLVSSATGASCGLSVKNNATTPNSVLDISATELVVRNSDGLPVLLSNVSTSVNIATSGAGGLDTGTEANSTWYYVWLVYNGSTVSGLLSVSATTPTMPSGYTYKALVGCVRNKSSGNFVKMRSVGPRVYQEPIAVLSNVAPTSAQTFQNLSIASGCPPAAVMVSAVFGIVSNAFEHFGVMADTNSIGLQVATGSSTYGVTLTVAGIVLQSDTTFRDIPLTTSQQIEWTNSTGYNTYIFITDFVLPIPG